MQEDAQITESLREKGWCVVPEFFTPEEVVSFCADLSLLQERLQRAGTGRGSHHAVRDQVRSDSVYWVESGSRVTPVQAALLSRIEALRQVLNRTLFLGLREFSGHYAVYPPGGFYRRHLDCFQGNSGRRVSVVIYLNSDWRESDGGCLRIYHARPPFDSKDGVNDFDDVAPRAGTLVCFMSEEKEHEVLPSQSTRKSFTGWFSAC